jgi:hypothetical protein
MDTRAYIVVFGQHSNPGLNGPGAAMTRTMPA